MEVCHCLLGPGWTYPQNTQATLDGRNPSKSHLKPWLKLQLKPLFVGIYRGSIVGFLKGGAISGFREHPQYDGVCPPGVLLSLRTYQVYRVSPSGMPQKISIGAHPCMGGVTKQAVTHQGVPKKGSEVNSAHLWGNFSVRESLDFRHFLRRPFEWQTEISDCFVPILLSRGNSRLTHPDGSRMMLGLLLWWLKRNRN